MKNAIRLVTVIAFVAIIGLTMSGCVTASSIGGTGDIHGLFSGGDARAAVSNGAQQIGTYSVILGLIDSGYEAYAAAVKAAEAEGKLVTTTTTSYIFLAQVRAFAQVQ